MIPHTRLLVKALLHRRKTRSQPSSDLPFEYCYDISPSQQTFQAPLLNLTMKGGDQFSVTNPFVTVPLKEGGSVFCLDIVKSEDINIIGQNFMTGYRVVFDREKNILGWKASNCYNAIESNTLPISPQPSSPSGSPSVSVGPLATSKNGSPNSSQAQPGSIVSPFCLPIFSLSYHCNVFFAACSFTSISCDNGP